MKLLLEGLFVALVLVLELVGLVMLGRYTVVTETSPPQVGSAMSRYIVPSDDDGGA